MRKGITLITPDLALYRPDRLHGATREGLRDDLNTILAIEVKKLNRNKSGSVARSSGLDYNTTPPCGKVRVYDEQGEPLDIRCFYLFVCLEDASEDKSKNAATAIALVDGNAINQDFELYISITGPREKKLGLGSYEDGIDRQRPMLVFPNPLGWKEINEAVSLIHPNQALDGTVPKLEKMYDMIRSTDGYRYPFGCYQLSEDMPKGWTVKAIENPFPTPADRQPATQQRGRFTLPLNL